MKIYIDEQERFSSKKSKGTPVFGAVRSVYKGLCAEREI